MPIMGIGSAAADDAVAALVAALTAATSMSLQRSNNLSDLASAATARSNLSLDTVYARLNPAAASYTYNSDGTVATETVSGVATTYTYNSDGTVATSDRSGVTRSYTYNSDGTLASVA